jgi:hypothetical protein
MFFKLYLAAQIEQYKSPTLRSPTTWPLKDASKVPPPDLKKMQNESVEKVKIKSHSSTTCPSRGQPERAQSSNQRCAALGAAKWVAAKFQTGPRWGGGGALRGASIEKGSALAAASAPVSSTWCADRYLGGCCVAAII